MEKQLLRIMLISKQYQHNIILQRIQSQVFSAGLFRRHPALFSGMMRT